MQDYHRWVSLVSRGILGILLFVSLCCAFKKEQRKSVEIAYHDIISQMMLKYTIVNDYVKRFKLMIMDVVMRLLL